MDGGVVAVRADHHHVQAVHQCQRFGHGRGLVQQVLQPHARVYPRFGRVAHPEVGALQVQPVTGQALLVEAVDTAEAVHRGDQCRVATGPAQRITGYHVDAGQRSPVAPATGRKRDDQRFGGFRPVHAPSGQHRQVVRVPQHTGAHDHQPRPDHRVAGRFQKPLRRRDAPSHAGRPGTSRTSPDRVVHVAQARHRTQVVQGAQARHARHRTESCTSRRHVTGPKSCRGSVNSRERLERTVSDENRAISVRNRTLAGCLDAGSGLRAAGSGLRAASCELRGAGRGLRGPGCGTRHVWATDGAEVLRCADAALAPNRGRTPELRGINRRRVALNAGVPECDKNRVQDLKRASVERSARCR